MINKKTLAYKSRFDQYMFLIIAIVLIPIGIFLYIKDTQKFNTALYVAAVVCGFLSLTQFIYLLPKPFKRIDYDNNGLYINKSKNNIIYIPYSKIINVKQDPESSRYKKFSFDTVRIVTKQKIYSVRYISKVDIVEIMLQKLVEE